MNLQGEVKIMVRVVTASSLDIYDGSLHMIGEGGTAHHPVIYH